MLGLHEPPAQLHCGVEWDNNTQRYTTTLRYLTGGSAGQQIPNGVIPVAVRPDGQTLQAADTANAIQNGLTSHDQASDKFTSAEFAVEMVQGAVQVEFQVQ